MTPEMWLEAMKRRPGDLPYYADWLLDQGHYALAGSVRLLPAFQKGVERRRVQAGLESDFFNVLSVRPGGAWHLWSTTREPEDDFRGVDEQADLLYRLRDRDVPDPVPEALAAPLRAWADAALEMQKPFAAQPFARGVLYLWLLSL